VIPVVYFYVGLLAGLHKKLQGDVAEIVREGRLGQQVVPA